MARSQCSTPKGNTGIRRVVWLAVAAALALIAWFRLPRGGAIDGSAGDQQQRTRVSLAPDMANGDRPQALALAARIKPGMTFGEVAKILPELPTVQRDVTHGHVICSVRGTSNWYLNFTFEHAAQGPLSEYKLLKAPTLSKRGEVVRVL